MSERLGHCPSKYWRESSAWYRSSSEKGTVHISVISNDSLRRVELTTSNRLAFKFESRYTRIYQNTFSIFVFKLFYKWYSDRCVCQVFSKLDTHLLLRWTAVAAVFVAMFTDKNSLSINDVTEKCGRSWEISLITIHNIICFMKISPSILFYEHKIPFIPFWNEQEMWGRTHAMNMKDGQRHPILSWLNFSVRRSSDGVRGTEEREIRGQGGRWTETWFTPI